MLAHSKDCQMSKQPFETENTPSKPKIEIKKPNAQSIFDNPNNPSNVKKTNEVNQKIFQEHASNVNNRLNSYNERAVDAVSSFMKLLDDQTLPQNKQSFASNLEQEVITKFQQLALDMEADNLQPNGMGSVGVITFLLKVALLQRDRMNKLEYQLQQMIGQVKTIKMSGIDTQSEKK